METPTQRNGRIFLEATAAGEPVFVIRAKDRHALAAIAAYRGIALEDTDEAFDDALLDIMDQFSMWQDRHPEKIKTPDIRA